MNRMIAMIGITVAAGALAAVPAVIGLSGNPSFSQQIPVRVPSQAAHVLDGGSAAPSRSGDERGGTIRHAEPGDDHPSSDDSGQGDGSDDHGGHGGDG